MNQSGQNSKEHFLLELDALRRQLSDLEKKVGYSGADQDSQEVDDRSAASSRHIYKKLQGALETTSEAAIVVDSGGQIVMANGMAEGLFLYEQKDLIGQAIGLLIPERFRNQHTEHLRHYFCCVRKRYNLRPRFCECP